MNQKDDVKQLCWKLLLTSTLSIREMAAQLKVSTRTVQKWKKELEEQTGEINQPIRDTELTEDEKKLLKELSSIKDKRSRNWTFVMYPESAPENWMDLLDRMHVAAAVSPLHDADLNGDGSEKKAHWHVVIAYENKKSYSQVKEDISVFNGVKVPQVVKDMRAMLRYFVHLDNPLKTQYDVKDIQTFGGFDLDTFMTSTKAERQKLIREMHAWIIETGCTEFIDLWTYAAVERYEDWYPLINDNCTLVLKTAIQSQRHKLQKLKDIGIGDDNLKYLDELKDEVTSNADSE